MSTSNKSLLGNQIGRTMVISFLLTGFMFFFALIIPLAPYNGNEWYGFLYRDLTLPEDERMNWGLAILESALLILMYFFGVIGLGSWAEYNNRLPSWGEVFTAGLFTLLASWLLPEIDVAGDAGSSFNHFTGDMKIAVFVITVIGVILMTLYLYYTEPVEE